MIVILILIGRARNAAYSSYAPDRLVNNVYFDSYDYFSYSENLAGVSGRCKLRYRWYGESRTPADGVLEMKYKRNFFGWKKRYRAEISDLSEHFTWNQLRKMLAHQLDPTRLLWLSTQRQWQLS